MAYDDPARSVGLPTMGDLKTHNGLLGDHKALNEAWETDGYWFFRGVLDRAAVARLRSVFVAELERQGVIDPVGEAPTDKSVPYNGASLANYPFRMEPLAEKAPWRDFVADPAIHGFFQHLFGDDPFWVPIVEYRATPPAKDPARARFEGIHQDGPFSPGIPFRICWIPLAEIDPDVGGLALAEGLTDQVNRHPLVAGSNTAIPAETIPANRWRRATYQAGDVLLMHLWTPHSGLSNVSERFRLSLDHRVMSRSDRCPVVGEVVEISASAIAVRQSGTVVHLTIEDDSYVRNDVGRKLHGPQIVEFFQPGDPVILAVEGDKATVVRPPH